MRRQIWKQSAVLLASLMLLALGTGRMANAQRRLPNPVLYLTAIDYYEANGKQWTRYKYSVDNSTVYPDAMFASAPDLPPCGANTKSSRTWVDFYDQSGKRLYGFCALGKATDLGEIWFALERDALPPSWIYIELTDRQTNTKYKSNLAETVQ